jgi:hypothetical protein
MPLDNEGSPPGLPRNLRPPPVAGRVVAMILRRPEETQAGDPEGEILGDRPRDAHSVEPPQGIAPVALSEGRIVGDGNVSILPPGQSQGHSAKRPTTRNFLKADLTRYGRNIGRPVARSQRGRDSSSLAMAGARTHGIGAVPLSDRWHASVSSRTPARSLECGTSPSIRIPLR